MRSGQKRYIKGNKRYAKAYRRASRKFVKRINPASTFVKLRVLLPVVNDNTGRVTGRISMTNINYPNGSILNSPEFDALASLYDNFRPCACRIQWIPNANVTVGTTNLTTGVVNSGMITCQDYNNTYVTPTTLTIEEILEYDNMKFSNTYATRKWFFRIKKMSPVDDERQSKLGYYEAEDSSAQPLKGVFYYSFNTALTAEPATPEMGKFLVTYYYHFINRR